MKKNTKKILFGTSIAIIILTHAYMLFYGLPANQMMTHAITNLVAGTTITITQWNKK